MPSGRVALTARTMTGLLYPQSTGPNGQERLARAWAKPARWGFVTEPNNTWIGLLYIATGFMFFLGAGVLAILMRVQLAIPGNNRPSALSSRSEGARGETTSSKSTRAPHFFASAKAADTVASISGAKSTGTTKRGPLTNELASRACVAPISRLSAPSRYVCGGRMAVSETSVR
jgi:hypothetical protein